MRKLIFTLFIPLLLVACGEEQVAETTDENQEAAVVEEVTGKSVEVEEEGAVEEEEVVEEQMTPFVGKWKITKMLLGSEKTPIDMEDAYFIFSPDKKFEKVNVEYETLKGTWAYEEDNGYIDMNFPDSQEKYHIEKMTDSELKLLKKAKDGSEMRKEFIMIRDDKAL